MIGIAILLLATLVALEFGVHIIYHAKTGKAGLYNPPFEYIKDIVEYYRRKHDHN